MSRDTGLDGGRGQVGIGGWVGTGEWVETGGGWGQGHVSYGSIRGSQASFHTANQGSCFTDSLLLILDQPSLWNQPRIFGYNEDSTLPLDPPFAAHPGSDSRTHWFGPWMMRMNGPVLVYS